MSPNLVLVVVAGVLIAAGVYLLLERSLTRVLIGVLLASNGVNVLFLVVSGVAGGAPIIGVTPRQEMSDPLPQAMVLTAIVITLGVTAYLLAMAYRSFQLNGHDEVPDDVEDAAIRHLADADRGSGSYDESVEGQPDEIGQGTGDEEGERVDEDDALRQGLDADASMAESGVWRSEPVEGQQR
jgi:multicomponent Na+:H+ antiporter subunit C